MHKNAIDTTLVAAGRLIIFSIFVFLSLYSQDSRKLLFFVILLYTIIFSFSFFEKKFNIAIMTGPYKFINYLINWLWSGFKMDKWNG